MPHDTEPVLLGKVVATHGLKGQLKVVPFSGECETIASLRSVILRGPGGAMETYEVGAATCHRNRVILTLKRFCSIDEVLHLVGKELYALRAQFPELPDGEYYWCDLVGLTVLTAEGVNLGVLTNIIATGSNDVYVVESGGREYLIPAIEEVVVNIDLDEGRMIVCPSDGLLDL